MADETKKYIIDIESNLKEYIDLLIEAKKANEDAKLAVDELKKGQFKSREEIELTNKAYRDSKKAVSDATKLVDLATKANKAKSGSYEQLLRQHQLMQTALKLEGGMMVKNADGTYTLTDKYIKLSKGVDEAKKGLDAFGKGIHDNRLNVGNYGEAVSSAFSQIGSVAGGTFGKVTEGVNQLSDGLMSLVKGGGVMGLVTAAIAVIAKVWKDAKENMDLFLKSADKLKYGFAGYSKDAEEARKDAIKRALGGVNTGAANRAEAERYLAFGGLTDEQRAYYEEQKKSSILMIKDNNALLESLKGYKDKVKWTLEYNKLLQESEAISDEKLAKETEWEGLEAKLTEQRAIAGKQGATALEIKNAAIAADEIANKLASEKIISVNKEIDNLIAISTMTATQEVVEDKLNGLLKERNTITKEYYSDQIKINRLAKTSTSKGGTNDEDAAKEKAAADLQILKDKTTADVEYLRSLLNVKKNEEIRVAEETGMAVAGIQEKYAAVELEIAKLTSEEKLALGANFAGNLATIFGENTAIGKAAAIAETTINTYAAATAAYKALAGVPGVGPILGAAAAAAAVAAGLANVKRIIAVKVPGGSGGGSTPTAISASAPAQRTFAQSAGSSILTQPQLSQSQLNAIPNQNLLTADDIARALAKMPAPIVTVEDINVRTDSVNKIKVRATI